MVSLEVLGVVCGLGAVTSVLICLLVVYLLYRRRGSRRLALDGNTYHAVGDYKPPSFTSGESVSQVSI